MQPLKAISYGEKHQAPWTTSDQKNALEMCFATEISWDFSVGHNLSDRTKRVWGWSNLWAQNNVYPSN